MNVALIHEARRLMTGANVHHLTGLVKMYEGAAAGKDLASQATAKMLEKELVRFVNKIRGERARAGKV